MSKKTEVIAKTYGSSWATVLIVGLIAGIIGALITTNPFTGFLAGFVLVLVTDFIMLASFATGTTSNSGFGENVKTAVWDYLGISEEEFRKRVLYGSCVKCGQTSKSTTSCLCVIHTRAYHNWQRHRERKSE
jgi:hypothetical protein